VIFLVSLVCFVSPVAVSSATTDSRPLVTAVYIGPEVDGASADAAFSRVAASGATAVRITLLWYQVAPTHEPKHWTPTRPGDAHYSWRTYDARIVNAVKHGLQPLVTILGAPTWAQTGGPAVEPPNSRLPSPTAFAQFATAAARRYSGDFGALPRVRWWQAWNEPNIHLYLVPQLVDKRPVSPGWYRTMLNRFADAVHGVHRDNLVVAGGLAPFRDNGPDVLAQDNDWGPLSFMRSLLCLSESLKPTCNERAHFDVWAHHPYTSGGPTHHAVLPNDVSLGDLPQMRKVLKAAIAARHVVSIQKMRFWVTEFSWDTSPPDPGGVPMTTAVRWVAEGLHRMWVNGVSLVTWLMLRDDPTTTSYLQSGLYYRGTSMVSARPKAIFTPFRFPFVAYKRKSGFYVWGRTPAGLHGNVDIQQAVNGRWKRVGTVAGDQHGIFEHTFRSPWRGPVRAVMGTSKAAAFSLTPVPDHFYNPFGLPTLLEPKHRRG
jgi:hypothetical protein